MRLIFIVVTLLLAGCSTPKIIVHDSNKSPPTLLLKYPNNSPWVLPLIDKLDNAKINYLIDKHQSTMTNIVYYDTIRVILELEGYAPSDVLRRCFGGGYNFESITAKLYDAKTGALLMSYQDSGYSEGCQPLSGKIYSNIVDMVLRGLE